MKRMRVYRIILLICILALVVFLGIYWFGYQKNEDNSAKTSEDKRNDIKNTTEVHTNDTTEFDDKTALQIKEFSVKLFQSSQTKDKNSLISPVSILYALGVAANGAQGSTKEEFQQAAGMDLNQWNQFLSVYQRNQPTGKTHQLEIANSVWVNENSNFQLNTQFEKNIKKSYQSEIFSMPYKKSTVTKMNDWVDSNTNHLIPSIIDKINDKDIMHIINAVAFEAQWENVYTTDEVSKGEFTTEDNKTQEVDMMYQKEEKYIQGDKETGFIKYYADRSFAFVALLPNENMTLDEYINGLTGDKLNTLITQAKDTPVDTSIPKFETTYKTKLEDTLKEMGIKEAFDPQKADFSKMGKAKQEQLFISSIIHKAHIVVDENGTKAGAATAIAMTGSSMIEIPEVYLERPFLYFVIDCKTNTPIFMGSIYNVK